MIFHWTPGVKGLSFFSKQYSNTHHILISTSPTSICFNVRPTQFHEFIKSEDITQMLMLDVFCHFLSSRLMLLANKYAYQGIRIASFSEYFAHVLNE